MQGGVLQTAAGARKLDTLGAMGQGHKGVLQVPQKIILTVNPVTAVQVQGIVNTKPFLFMIDTGRGVRSYLPLVR